MSELPPALDQLTADARLAVELREEAETHRIEGSDDYFCGGRLMRAAADAIERLQNSSAPETPAEPARLTDVQCDDVIDFLADYEWSGLTRDNVRTWDQAIRDAVKTTCEPGP